MKVDNEERTSLSSFKRKAPDPLAPQLLFGSNSLGDSPYDGRKGLAVTPLPKENSLSLEPRDKGISIAPINPEIRQSPAVSETLGFSTPGGKRLKPVSTAARENTLSLIRGVDVDSIVSELAEEDPRELEAEDHSLCPMDVESGLFHPDSLSCGAAGRKIHKPLFESPKGEDLTLLRGTSSDSSVSEIKIQDNCKHVRVSNNRPLNPDLPGFVTAGGKRLKPVSKEAIGKAISLVEETEADSRFPELGAGGRGTNLSAIKDIFSEMNSAGFSTASGKKIHQVSRAAKDKALSLIRSIDLDSRVSESRSGDYSINDDRHIHLDSSSLITAGGKRLNPVSASMEKDLTTQVDFRAYELEGEDNNVKIEVNSDRSLRLDSTGFSTASGKRLKPVSKLAQEKASSFFKQLDAENTTLDSPHSVGRRLEFDSLSSKSDRYSALQTVRDNIGSCAQPLGSGFSTAGGKDLAPVSKTAKDKASSLLQVACSEPTDMKYNSTLPGLGRHTEETILSHRSLLSSDWGDKEGSKSGTSWENPCRGFRQPIGEDLDRKLEISDPDINYATGAVMDSIGSGFLTASRRNLKPISKSALQFALKLVEDGEGTPSKRPPNQPLDTRLGSFEAGAPSGPFGINGTTRSLSKEEKTHFHSLNTLFPFQ
ncbi:hypothetical protein HDU67_009991 [Dinochytrium kinnereticum]|nr:hypothetical protein HDU67_009991 [Dinochytrium kinnereticum]